MLGGGDVAGERSRKIGLAAPDSLDGKGRSGPKNGPGDVIGHRGPGASSEAEKPAGAGFRVEPLSVRGWTALRPRASSIAQQCARGVEALRGSSSGGR
jgi:hypothetical protein